MNPRNVRLFDRISRNVAGSRSVPSPSAGPLYWAIRPQTGTRELVEQWQHRLPDRPADILEVNVDAVWRRSRQLGWKIGCTVIDRGVEAQFLLRESAFFRAAGNADCPRAGELGELADQRPDRSA